MVSGSNETLPFGAGVDIAWTSAGQGLTAHKPCSGRAGWCTEWVRRTAWSCALRLSSGWPRTGCGDWRGESEDA